MTRSNIDPDVLLSEVFELRDELSGLGEVVSNKRLTAIILNALPEVARYSTIKVQSIRDLDLGLDRLISMIKTIFISHLERSSVSKRSQKSYRKV